MTDLGGGLVPARRENAKLLLYLLAPYLATDSRILGRMKFEPPQIAFHSPAEPSPPPIQEPPAPLENPDVPVREPDPAEPNQI